MLKTKVSQSRRFAQIAKACSTALVFLCALAPASSAEMGDVRKLAFKGIQDRSPYGRYSAQSFSPGVKSFRREGRCVIPDLVQFFQLQQNPIAFRMSLPSDVYYDKKPNSKTRDLSLHAEYFETTLVAELEKIMALFPIFADPVVRNREICLTTGTFERPNALSIGLGFIVFDPHLFFQIIRHPQANSWSLLAIVAHEFAHQLQVWHLDPLILKEKAKRRYVRDMELQADCAAAAMLARLHAVNPRENEGPFALALADAFMSLGDFELDHYEGHHGTAWERQLMIEAGLNVSQELQKQNNKTSASMLLLCRQKIEWMNTKYGPDLWPIGSQLPRAQK
jgi:hypothetical protein